MLFFKIYAKTLAMNNDLKVLVIDGLLDAIFLFLMCMLLWKTRVVNYSCLLPDFVELNAIYGQLCIT